MSERLKLTPAVAQGQGWSVMARCEHCQASRSAFGAWKTTARDRDLIEALERGRLSCMKCRRPCRALFVGKAWPGGGYQRIMSIRIGARVELHDEPPTYPEPPPGIGSST